MLTEWFLAARNGNDEQVSKLLVENPDLIARADGDRETALHHAARGGHETVVARLLAARPALVPARNCLGWNALDFAASKGHHSIVARILATDVPHIGSISIGLYHAVKEGHGNVVELLLNAKPGLTTLTVMDEYAVWTLFSVIERGLEKVFTRLLVICPALIDAVGDRDITALHCAAKHGHENLVTQILGLRPQMISLEDRDGWNALVYAVERDHQSIAERLLATKPELIFSRSTFGDTILHCAVRKCSNQKFVAKLWRLNPQALTHANSYHRTPFHWAVAFKREELIELFQWSMSFDEIVYTYTQNFCVVDYQDKYKPIIEQQCELLFECLHQDVVGTVFGYLGFDPVKRAGNKATKGSSPQGDEGEQKN